MDTYIPLNAPDIAVGSYAEFKDKNDLEWQVLKYVGVLVNPVTGQSQYVSTPHDGRMPREFEDLEVRVYLWDEIKRIQ